MTNAMLGARPVLVDVWDRKVELAEVQLKMDGVDGGGCVVACGHSSDTEAKRCRSSTGKCSSVAGRQARTGGGDLFSTPGLVSISDLSSMSLLRTVVAVKCEEGRVQRLLIHA